MLLCPCMSRFLSLEVLQPTINSGKEIYEIFKEINIVPCAVIK